MTTLEERREWIMKAFRLLKSFTECSAEWTAQRAVIDAKLVEYQEERKATGIVAFEAAP